MPGFMVVILIGAAVGFVARLLYPGPNTPHGFILTTVLGVCGAASATFFYRFVDCAYSIQFEAVHTAANINHCANPVTSLSIWFGAWAVMFVLGHRSAEAH